MVLTGACQEKDTVERDPGAHLPLAEINGHPDYVALPFVGTKWKLIGFADAGTNTIKLAAPSEGDTYTLKFEKDGTLSGVSSTNEIMSTYTLDGHALQFTAWGGTKINELLDGPSYVKAIEQVYSYQLSEKGLILNYEVKKYLLFQPVDL